MDINFNRIEPSRQVGNVDKTKRVRKPNKDEAEQNGKNFKDQLDLASGGEKEQKHQDEAPTNQVENASLTQEKEQKQLPPPKEDEEKIIGGNLDITV